MLSLWVGPSAVWNSFSTYMFPCKGVCRLFFVAFHIQVFISNCYFFRFSSLRSLFFLPALSRNGTVHKHLSEERLAGASALNHRCTVLKVHLHFGREKNLQPFLKQDFNLWAICYFWCVKYEGFLCETDREKDHRRPGVVTQVTAGLFAWHLCHQNSLAFSILKWDFLFL